MGRANYFVHIKVKKNYLLCSVQLYLYIFSPVSEYSHSSPQSTMFPQVRNRKQVDGYCRVETNLKQKILIVNAVQENFNLNPYGHGDYFGDALP